MPDWRPVAGEQDFRNRLRVEIEDHAFALFRLADGIFALDDVCSHEYSRLSEGEIWEDEVYCPKHGSRFKIRDGSVCSFPATSAVKRYPVKVEDGIIFIDVENLA